MHGRYFVVELVPEWEIGRELDPFGGDPFRKWMEALDQASLLSNPRKPAVCINGEMCQ